MYKLLTLSVTLAALFMLSSCDDAGGAEAETDAPVELKMNLPPALADCKSYRVTEERGFRMIITRCPNSTTTTQAGKVTTVVEESPVEEE